MPRRHYQPCSLDDCERIVHSHGLCHSHARRLLLYGDPLAGQRRHRAANDAPEEFIEAALLSSTDDCIDWPFALSPSGYGLFEQGRAHIVVCERAHGPRPEGLQVCHSCADHPHCVNPRHLRWDTPKANVADRERDRKAKGLRGYGAKLSVAQVEQIRARYLAGGVSQQALADEYGVSQNAISKLVRV